MSDTGYERVRNAELKISEIADGDAGPLRVSSLSSAVIEDEYREATETGMLPLIGLALLLIVVLILLFNAYALGPAADAGWLALLVDLGHRGGRLARAGRTGSHRTSELTHNDGADHCDQPYCGLCDPDCVALP